MTSQAHREPSCSTVHSVDDLTLDQFSTGSMHRVRVNLVGDALGRQTWVPLLVAKGIHTHPTVLVTAVMHGNELNGIPVIHRLFQRLNPQELYGTVVGVPVINVPGLLKNSREFGEGHDLNRLMPGRADGNSSEVYAHRFVERILKQANYLVDLHTANFGRANSLYIRADLTDPITSRMARLQQAQIVVHNTGADGTLRSAAADLGISAITVEMGDPQRFQGGMIRDACVGIESLLIDLHILRDQELLLEEEPVICCRSYWIYADTGGLLEVLPKLAARVEGGHRIARLTDVFGGLVRHYNAPEDGVVVGKSTNPVCNGGSRILHLGVEGVPDRAASPLSCLAHAT